MPAEVGALRRVHPVPDVGAVDRDYTVVERDGVFRVEILGPVDPQLGEYPAASVVKAVSRKPIAEVDDKTLILADVGEKALVQVRESTRELLTRSQPPEKARELAELLATGTWTHDFPITVDVAQKLGLKVRSDMPAEFLQLMSLFPQPVRRQPSVEYIPTRRRAEQPSPPQNLA